MSDKNIGKIIILLVILGIGYYLWTTGKLGAGIGSGMTSTGAQMSFRVRAVNEDGTFTEYRTDPSTGQLVSVDPSTGLPILGVYEMPVGLKRVRFDILPIATPYYTKTEGTPQTITQSSSLTYVKFDTTIKQTRNNIYTKIVYDSSVGRYDCVVPSGTYVGQNATCENWFLRCTSGEVNCQAYTPSDTWITIASVDIEPWFTDWGVTHGLNYESTATLDVEFTDVPTTFQQSALGLLNIQIQRRGTNLYLMRMTIGYGGIS